MKINVHAGHNPDGMVACGAIGLIKESTEARKVTSLLITQLDSRGHTVHDCTINDGKNSGDVLTRIVQKCNENDVDLDISIHFNAGANAEIANNATTGVEVLVYDESSLATRYAEKICEKISELGFRNRGVKVRKDLYVLNQTKAPAVLVECCFVDDADDVAIYQACTMARAISEAIGGEKDMIIEKRYNTIEELPEWAMPTISKLVEDGKIADPNNLDLTYDMVRILVICNK